MSSQEEPARRHFHEELRELERRLQEMGSAVQQQVDKAVTGLVNPDSDSLQHVISDDDRIDEFYLEIESRILDLFALQTPVASDLRFLTVALHVNFHLERVADMAVNMSKLGLLAKDLPRSPEVVAHLGEMGNVALQLLDAAMSAFGDRDLELCERLPKMDDPIDRLNRGMLSVVLTLAHDQELLEWGIRMHVVSRQIERIGDHAVDIGEQVAFLITGEFREFADASHPLA